MKSVDNKQNPRSSGGEQVFHFQRKNIEIKKKEGNNNNEEVCEHLHLRMARVQCCWNIMYGSSMHGDESEKGRKALRGAFWM